jgi:hypothetical protein
VDGRRRARRQDRPLHPSLTAVGQEGAEVGEAAELVLVDGGLGARRQRLAHLGDHEPHVVGGHLHPRVALDAEQRPQLEPQAGHEELGLVPGLPVEGHQLVTPEALAEALGHEADLGGTDGVQAAQQGQDDDQDRHPHDDEHGHFVPPPANRSSLATIA